MHHQDLTQNIGGTIGGACGTVVGTVFGWIGENHTLGFITNMPEWAVDLLQTCAMALIGAVIGFYTNKLLKWLHK